MKTGSKQKPVKQPWQRLPVHFTPWVAAGTILILLPPFVPLDVQTMLTKVLIFAIFAMSLDLIMGYTGLLSLGHAAFFGIGAYGAGILIVKYGIESFWISAPLGILMATLVAAVFGPIVLRVRGIYFLLVTCALGQLLSCIAVWWDPMTGGYDGLWGIPRPVLGLTGFTWDNLSLYYFVFVIFALCSFVLYRLIGSPFGYALRGIRESELRMRTLGYNTWLYKYIAFVIAGFFAGVAGVLYGATYGAIRPSALALDTSALVMLMVIIGGAGTLFGSVIGSGVISLMHYFISWYLPERWPLIVGVVFVAAVMYARGGIIIHLRRLWRKVSYQYGSVKG